MRNLRYLNNSELSVAVTLQSLCCVVGFLYKCNHTDESSFAKTPADREIN